jgi:CMP-N-acetylneuraminic acid synthetase
MKIANAIEIMLKTRSTTQADQLTFAIFEDKMLQGKASVKVCEHLLADVKKTCPLRDSASIAKATDLVGGTLNHEGLHVLRQVRTPDCTTG